MEQPSDRMRLKDKIIDNISKSIKSIHERLYYQSKDADVPGIVILCNRDRPCHKLCESLDHALLHGLKKVTSGYWRVVKQFSHKEMVKEIDMLTNVTTELGKGRAWLYASLNEGLLQSYIRLLCENEKLLKKYYAKEALMLDGDRMNILLTHTSGLDRAIFQLDYDLQYLDLNACPPRNHIMPEEEDFFSSSSLHSLTDLSGVFPWGLEVSAGSVGLALQPHCDSDSVSLASVDVHSPPEIIHQMKASTISADSGFHNDAVFTNGIKQRSVTPPGITVNGRERVGTPTDNVSISSFGSSGDPDRHTRLENIIPGGNEGEGEMGDNSLEVIRMRNKKEVNRNKRKKTPTHKHMDGVEKNSVTFITGQTNDADLPVQEINDSKATTDQQNKKGISNCTAEGIDKNDGIFVSDAADENLKQNLVNPSPQSIHSDYEIVPTSISKFGSEENVCDTNIAKSKSLAFNTCMIDNTPCLSLEDSNKSQTFSGNSKSVQALIESKIAGLCSLDDMDNPCHESELTDVKSEPSDHQALKDCSNTLLNNKIIETADCISPSSGGLHTKIVNSMNALGLNQHLKTSLDSAVNNDHDKYLSCQDERADPEKRDKVQAWQETSSEAEDSFDVYSCSKPGSSRQQLRVESGTTTTASHLKDYVNFILQSPESPTSSDIKEKLVVHEKKVDLSLSLDNNTKLQLMLDIFVHEDETLMKIFATREKHTEGDSSIVFVMISDKYLYLLHYHQSTRKFVMQSSAMLQDLIFISTGLNEQTLNIESRGKNKQKQRLWLTPGHQALTQAILTCLTDAVQAAIEQEGLTGSKFTVGSEIPSQTIALRKYISRELQCEDQDVTISDYSLVFWEDLSTTDSHPHDGASKEGTLLILTQEPLKGYTWKPVYVVLKNFMLFVFNKKSDPRPHTYLAMRGDQCVGCCLTSTADREHCVELILSDGRKWYLTAASVTEIAEWNHALCLAVSQGSVDEVNALSSCVACCAVLSCNRLFLCHEDLHTKFYRTVGRALLEDIMGISVGDVGYFYCIIEFESQDAGMSSDKWVFYFSSAEDLERFKAALIAAWNDIYKVDLPVSPLDNMMQQQHCCAFSDHLKQQLILR